MFTSLFISLNMEQPREELKNVLEMNISFEEYDGNRENNIPELYKAFMKEYFHQNELRRQGGSMTKVISEWLRGLPSVVDMPFYTADVINLMKAVGYEVDSLEPHQIDDLYWTELGIIINQNK